MSSAPVRHTSSTIPIEQLPTLVHVLAARAEERGDKILYTYLEDGRKHSTISYAQLDSAARAVASALSQCASRGDRALLLYPPGIEFAKAFFGCLYAGIIAVPAYPPDPARLDRSLPRLRSIMRDADATIVLTTKFLTSLAASMLNDVPDLASLRWIATDTVPQDEGTDWEMQPIGEDTLAFLQYTSGSTGNPKGVMVTHRNLAENERMIKRATRQTEDSIMAGWLPIFHDMGLVGQLLEPLFTGGSCVLMSPIEFLQKPISWLRTISEFDVTIAGGPNFAYDLCVRKATEQDKRTLDLSRWVVAFNGAEPIRKDTIDRFVEAFAPCGFRREAFLPCYGLAEATLYVTGAAFGPSSVAVRADRLAAHQVLDAIPEAAAQLLVSSGESPSELQVLIVDPARLERCPSDQVGEIWVAGPSVARGYWNKSAETERIFHAHLATGEGPFLRTGDLGFLRRGQLMITGRMKDLIVLHGRNHYPHDLEATMEAAHVAVRTGCTAAFSVDIANEERLVLVAEVDTRRAPTLEVVVAAISTLIAQRHGIHAHSVVLIEPRTIYKTSSGKLQRFECKNAFLRGALTVLHKSHGIALATADGRGPEARPHRAEVTPPESPVNAEVKTASASPSSGTEQEARPTRSSEEIETWIRDWLAEHLECSSESIDRDTPLESFGLDSVDEVLLIGELRDWLGDKVTPTEAYQYPTVRRFSSYLSSKCDALASRSPTKHLIDSTSRIERW